MLPSLLLVALSLLPAVHAVWPIPKEISTGDSVLFIDESLEITYNGEPLTYSYGYAPASGPKCNDKDVVQGGISRAMEAIFHHNFVPWKLRPPHTSFEPDLEGGKESVASLTINQASEGDGTYYKPLAGEIDESYSLELTEDGAAIIEAETSIGVLRGLETFVQLFYQHTSGSHWYTEEAPVSIKDEPKFVHRGMLLDLARSWFPVEDILRTIDALSWNKMNRLHLHITDTQSWPLEIPAMPELAELGSYRKGLTYSPEDLAHIQEYGAHRGVEVYVEVDMPTHVGRGVVDAYPDIIAAYAQQPYQWYCAQPPCGMYKLNNQGVYDFLEKLFDDLLPRVVPYSSYFHTGGDEFNKNSSTLDDGVQSNDTEVIRPFLQKFTDFAHEQVRKAGLTPLVWEEMAIEWEQDLGEDVVVQCWLGAPCIKNVTSKGRKAIDSNSEAWYLSCGKGQWLDFENGPVYQKYYPFNDWCGPFKNWKFVYSHDPVAGLSEEEAQKVLGGEVALWSETLDPLMLDSQAWPRAGAAGEVLWSGRQDAAGQNRSLVDAGERLADMRERMVARGVKAEHLTQVWCLQAEDPLACAQVE